MTLEETTSDAAIRTTRIAVTEYLREKIGQDALCLNCGRLARHFAPGVFDSAACRGCDRITRLCNCEPVTFDFGEMQAENP